MDDDDVTQWATDAGVKQCWLEVDLGAPQTFARAIIDGVRVRAFQLQYQEGNDWKTFFQGTLIGEDHEMAFDPVTARRVRLNIEAEPAMAGVRHGPAINEFQLFAPASRKTSP